MFQQAADAPPPYSSLGASNAGKAQVSKCICVLLYLHTIHCLTAMTWFIIDDVFTHDGRLIHAIAVAFFEYKEDEVYPKPPSYNVATSLPSYDEAERNKAEATVPLVTDRVSMCVIYR